MKKTKRKRIVLSENKSKLIIEDDLGIKPSYFKPEDKYKFLRSQEKCDYIVEFYNSNNKVLFVELKGNKFEKAVKQLENTIKKLQNNYSNYEKCCLYVGRKIPSSKSNKLHRYKEKFKTFGTVLVTKTKSCLIKTSSILECKCECA